MLHVHASQRARDVFLLTFVQLQTEGVLMEGLARCRYMSLELFWFLFKVGNEYTSWHAHVRFVAKTPFFHVTDFPLIPNLNVYHPDADPHVGFELTSANSE